MKRYALMKRVPGSEEYQADMNDTYTADEAGKMVWSAYRSHDMPRLMVPMFLEFETDAPETPGLQADLPSVSDE